MKQGQGTSVYAARRREAREAKAKAAAEAEPAGEAEAEKGVAPPNNEDGVSKGDKAEAEAGNKAEAPSNNTPAGAEPMVEGQANFGPIFGLFQPMLRPLASFFFGLDNACPTKAQEGQMKTVLTLPHCDHLFAFSHA